MKRLREMELDVLEAHETGNHGVIPAKAGTQPSAEALGLHPRGLREMELDVLEAHEAD
jgi:hypothetical protein